MLARFLIYLTSLSPRIKETLWKWWYQKLSAFYTKDDFRFMNYGYTSSHEEKVILQEADEKNRFFIQLYAHVLSGIDIQGKDVLEVGSGRGGGADYIARYLKPSSITGVDFSKNAVDLACQFHNVPTLKFIVGNAEALPFESAHFDAVLNVESSHCYGDMEAFISETKRVLKNGGVFAWCDLRKKEEMEETDRLFMDSGLELLFKEEITPHVIEALEMISRRKEEAIKKKVFFPFQKIFSEFAGVQGSEIYNRFKDGSLVYWHYRLKK